MRKKKQTKKNNAEKKPSINENIDFSFQDDAVEKEVDKLLGTIKDEQKTESQHITEKIKTGMEIRKTPPDKGFLNVKAEKAMVTYKDKYGEEHVSDKVIITSKDINNVEYMEITDGLFNIDLRNDSIFWFIRSPVVVPSMITQAVRTHLDIKKCHEPEKRKVEIPLILILALIGGAVLILFMLFSLFS